MIFQITAIFLYFCVFTLNVKHIELTYNEMCFLDKIAIAIKVSS